MFCKNCGTDLGENVSVCTNCGAAVTNESSPVQELGANPLTANNSKDKFAVAGLVLSICGILGLCCSYLGIICAILGIIFGVLGLKSNKKGMATAAIVVGGVTLLISIASLIIGIVIATNSGGIQNWLQDMIEQARENS